MLRILRLLLVVRVFHRVAGLTFRCRVLTYVLGSARLLAHVNALAVLEAEENTTGANIRSFGDALWLAVVMITTVGYAERYPITR